jgi:hypothetical protein
VKSFESLFLCQVTVQLLTRQAKESKHNAKLMGKLLASQKHDNTGLESASAECQKKGRPIGFSTRSDSHKFLHQATGNATFWVHEKPYWLIERHLDKLVDGICHGGGK